MDGPRVATNRRSLAGQSFLTNAVSGSLALGIPTYVNPRLMKCALFVVLLCPLTVETYEEVSSLRKELPNEVKRLLSQTHVLNLADASATSKALLPEAPHSPRPQPPFSQLLAGVPDAAQARIKRLQDAATSMQSDVAALSTAKSSEEALRLISGIVKAYDGELYR